MTSRATTRQSCRVTVGALAVAVAPELPGAAQRRVGVLDDPAQSEPHRHLRSCGDAGHGATLDVEITEAVGGQLAADLRIVVARGRGAESRSPPRSRRSPLVESRTEKFDVVAMGAVDRLPDRDAVRVTGDGPDDDALIGHLEPIDNDDGHVEVTESPSSRLGHLPRGGGLRNRLETADIDIDVERPSSSSHRRARPALRASRCHSCQQGLDDMLAEQVLRR